MERRIAGVFEGGGAKGIAYAGAVEALECEHVEFEAVAGASAGAITAALIAAGCGAAELRDATGKALAAIDLKSRLRMIGRLRDPSAAGLAQTNHLREVIQETMATSLGCPVDHDPITFKELYDAKHIELFVVAVDTYVRQHLVFHHRITPEVSVVDAVVASSSIPLVFGPSRAIRCLDEVKVANAVVDGGVWTNFPLFVFSDLHFRRFHDLGDPPQTVIGFQLAEPKHSLQVGAVTEICSTVPDDAVASEELIRRGTAAVVAEKSKPKKQGFWQEGREAANDPIGSSDLNERDQISAYPLATGTWLRFLQGYVELGLSSLHQWPYALPVAMACIIGPVIGVVLAWEWMFSVDGGWQVLSTLAFVIVVLVAIGVVTVSVVGIVANALLLHPLRRLAYPVGSTYAAASGVPYWLIHCDRSPVIALPVDPALTTLAFDPDQRVIDAQIRAARETTTRRLREILAEGTSSAPQSAS